MKKHLVFLSLVPALFGAPAFAADMPVKALPVPPPVYSWTGFYLGANAGWIGEKETWTYTNPAPATPPTSSAHDIRADDAVFGAHIGVQYQFYHIVVGGEAALSTAINDTFGTSGTQCVAAVGSICQARTKDLMTAGGRLGFAWDRWLLFASGGWAWANVDSQELTAPPTIFDRTTALHNGNYVGGGVEYAWFDNIILGLEYQHIQLKTTFHASSFDAGGPSPPGVNGRNISGSEDIVRGRLSFKGGWW